MVFLLIRLLLLCELLLFFVVVEQVAFVVFLLVDVVVLLGKVITYSWITTEITPGILVRQLLILVRKTSSVGSTFERKATHSCRRFIAVVAVVAVGGAFVVVEGC